LRLQLVALATGRAGFLRAERNLESLPRGKSLHGLYRAQTPYGERLLELEAIGGGALIASERVVRHDGSTIAYGYGALSPDGRFDLTMREQNGFTRLYVQSEYRCELDSGVAVLDICLHAYGIPAEVGEEAAYEKLEFHRVSDGETGARTAVIDAREGARP
jgi:hypothetical protein